MKYFKAIYSHVAVRNGKRVFLFKNIECDGEFYRDHVWMQAKHITANQKKKFRNIKCNSPISFKAKPITYRHFGQTKKAFRSIIEVKEIE